MIQHYQALINQIWPGCYIFFSNSNTVLLKFILNSFLLPLNITLTTFRHYFNDESIKDDYLDGKVKLVASIPLKIELLQLENFKKRAFDALGQNLCSHIGIYSRLAIKPCQTYLSGFASKGFKQTYDMYTQNAKNVALKILPQFIPYPCTIQNCSPYYQHQFAIILLGETSRNLVNILTEQMNAAFQKMIEKSKLKMMYKIAGLIILSIMYIVYSRYLRERCRMGLQFFGIVPRNIMCRLKMTIYMKKNNFLSKLDIL